MKRAIRIIGEMLQFMMMASRPLLARFAFLSWCHNKGCRRPSLVGFLAASSLLSSSFRHTSVSLTVCRNSEALFGAPQLC